MHDYATTYFWVGGFITHSSCCSCFNFCCQWDVPICIIDKCAVYWCVSSWVKITYAALRSGSVALSGFLLRWYFWEGSAYLLRQVCLPWIPSYNTHGLLIGASPLILWGPFHTWQFVWCGDNTSGVSVPLTWTSCCKFGLVHLHFSRHWFILRWNSTITSAMFRFTLYVIWSIMLSACVSIHVTKTSVSLGEHPLWCCRSCCPCTHAIASLLPPAEWTLASHGCLIFWRALLLMLPRLLPVYLHGN